MEITRYDRDDVRHIIDGYKGQKIFWLTSGGFLEGTVLRADRFEMPQVPKSDITGDLEEAALRNAEALGNGIRPVAVVEWPSGVGMAFSAADPVPTLPEESE